MRREFLVGAGDLASADAGPGDQHQPGAARVGQGVDGGRVAASLFFQTGQRAQARRVALACVEEAAPGAGQLQQPDGVSGRRGVEDDVVVARRSARGR